jgi:hypothetical protein
MARRRVGTGNPRLVASTALYLRDEVALGGELTLGVALGGEEPH